MLGAVESTGFSISLMTAEGADVASPLPEKFAATTCARRRCPTSAVPSEIDSDVVPETGAHCPPASSHRSHEYAKVGSHSQIPGKAVSAWPRVAVPDKLGGDVRTGTPGGTVTLTSFSTNFAGCSPGTTCVPTPTHTSRSVGEKPSSSTIAVVKWKTWVPLSLAGRLKYFVLRAGLFGSPSCFCSAASRAMFEIATE